MRWVTLSYWTAAYGEGGLWPGRWWDLRGDPGGAGAALAVTGRQSAAKSDPKRAMGPVWGQSRADAKEKHQDDRSERGTMGGDKQKERKKVRVRFYSADIIEGLFVSDTLEDTHRRERLGGKQCSGL